VLVSDEGRACLANAGLTWVAGNPNSPVSTPDSESPKTNGVSTLRWSPRERLDPERFGSKSGSDPTRMSDIYSMAMTIYEVSILRYKSGQAVDAVAGSDGRSPVPRAQQLRGSTSYPSRRTTEETDFCHHPGIHTGTVGYDGILLGCGSHQAAYSRPPLACVDSRRGAVETEAWRPFYPGWPELNCLRRGVRFTNYF
jgi:serine/threonine protein kinase